jgi:hypothetical protein
MKNNHSAEVNIAKEFFVGNSEFSGVFGNFRSFEKAQKKFKSLKNGKTRENFEGEHFAFGVFFRRKKY